jgi:hypothetical protein
MFLMLWSMLMIHAIQKIMDRSSHLAEAEKVWSC